MSVQVALPPLTEGENTAAVLQEQPGERRGKAKSRLPAAQQSLAERSGEPRYGRAALGSSLGARRPVGGAHTSPSAERCPSAVIRDTLKRDLLGSHLLAACWSGSGRTRRAEPSETFTALSSFLLSSSSSSLILILFVAAAVTPELRPSSACPAR